MNIAILGGGFAGLTAAHYLSKNNYHIEIFERSVNLGGLAAGFKAPEWEWPLEHAYHHIFASDHYFTNFANDTGYNKVQFYDPLTSSLYYQKSNSINQFTTYQLDNPFHLLSLPLLTRVERFRAGAVLGFFKIFSTFIDL